MADSYSMDLTGHVPGRGANLPDGTYAMKISKQEVEAGTEKGNRIKFYFLVTAGEQKGRTVVAYLYVIDDEFSGSEGHRGATLDNWYSLLMATKIKPGKFDARKVALKLVGKKLAGEIKEGKPTKDGKVFSNIVDYLPIASMGSVADEPSVDEDDLDEDYGDADEVGFDEESGDEEYVASEADEAEAEESPEEAKPAPKKKKKATRKKKAAKPAPEPEPSDDEPEESAEVEESDEDSFDIDEA